jgi:hypothetical protein
MEGCPYGQTLEPDPAPGRQTLPGREDAVRPVVMAPYFPLPAEGRAGLEVPLRVMVVGESAWRHLPALLCVVGEEGQRGGLGADGAPFDLVGPDWVEAVQLRSIYRVQRMRCRDVCRVWA